jgi:FAD/FMN-containing dehydrogenase
MTSYSDPIHNLIYNNDASHIQTKSNVEVYIPKTKEDVKGIVSACVTHNRKIICR